LVAAAAARRHDPALPATLEDVSRVQGLLAGPSLNGLGAAAMDGEGVIGFLVPLACVLWDRPAAYVPEWGWAAADADVVVALYEVAAVRWVEAGRTTHAVTVWADESEMEDAWHRLGFGRVVVDALRDLGPVEAPRATVPIRRASPGDAADLADLEHALWEYLAAPPICRVHPPPGGSAETAQRLADPAQPVWMAGPDGSPVGFLWLQSEGDPPAALCSSALVRCDGALVLPGERRQGVGAALLGAAVEWARASGFTGCTLDYESANPAAARFWPWAGFRPVLHSLARKVA